MPKNGFSLYTFYIDGTTVLHVGHFSVQDAPTQSSDSHILYCPICNVTTIVPFCQVPGVQLVFIRPHTKEEFSSSSVNVTQYMSAQSLLFLSKATCSTKS